MPAWLFRFVFNANLISIIIVYGFNRYAIEASLVDALGKHKTCPYDAQLFSQNLNQS